jgi:hypothetical protein
MSKKTKLTRKDKKKYTKKTMGECHKPETLGKHYTKSKKGKKPVSAKQRKNLAAGRKVLKFLRTGRQISEPKQPLLITEGRIMAGKKKQSKSSKLHGFEGKKKHSKKGKYLHGATDGFNPGNLAMDIAGILAGAIGVSFIASFLPIKNAKLKTMFPIGLGLIGLSMPKLAKNRFINRAALGSLSMGGYSLTKQLAPSLPLMGAADTAEGIGYAIENLPPEEKAILGILPEQQQLEYQGEDQPGETTAGVPGQMLGEEDTELTQGIPSEMLGEYDLQGAEGEDFE